MRSSNVSVRGTLNVSRLRDTQMCKGHEDQLDTANSENTWPAFKECIYGISEGLGYVERKAENWFDNNDAEIEEILREKQKALLCLLWGNLSHNEQKKGDWWNQGCEEKG